MSESAGSLHCPNCGGPAAPGDHQCRYCHAELATVSCPACFALMFEGSRYCPACGARPSRAAGAPDRARCPGCGSAMRQVTLGSTELLECARCHGTWVDAETFERICAGRETQVAVLHQWTAPPPQRASVGDVHYRPCLACGKMMNRLNFARLSGTIIDACKGHGTFLDAGELHAIVSFIQSGGLERARQRQLEDIKDEERQLQSLQQAQAMRDAVIGERPVSSGSWNGFDLLSLLDYLKR